MKIMKLDQFFFFVFFFFPRSAELRRILIPLRPLLSLNILNGTGDWTGLGGLKKSESKGSKRGNSCCRPLLGLQ